MKSIKDNILFYHDSIQDLLEALNQGIIGVILIVDEMGKMVGLFTDGDMRRALLAGARLSEPVERYMNRNFTAGKISNSRMDNLNLLSESIRHLPIVDDYGRPMDVISWAEMWRLPIMEPALGGNELKYVSDCITTNWISSQGEYVSLFEKTFASYLNCEHALCTSNGTTALHLAMAALGIGPGDEVLVPDLTFGASANAVIHTGATPVFVDITKDTWTIDPVEAEKRITERTKAIMPVHLYGHPCDMDPIMDLARQHNLFVVEDCAEALGARYKGHMVGTIGDVGCFSFFANKVITTGEGGMVSTSNTALLQKMKTLRDHGMEAGRRYWHVYPGFNYRLTNIQAAIGLAQMERIDAFMEARQERVKRYRHHLSDIPGIIQPPHANWAHNIYWLYSIVIDETQTGFTREVLMEALRQKGIETRPFFYPMHIQPAFAQSKEGSFPVSDWVGHRGVSLPTSTKASLEDVDTVCGAIRQFAVDTQLIQSYIVPGTDQTEQVVEEI